MLDVILFFLVALALLCSLFVVYIVIKKPGLKGDRGLTGIRGPQGPPGVQGAAGPKCDCKAAESDSEPPIGVRNPIAPDLLEIQPTLLSGLPAPAQTEWITPVFARCAACRNPIFTGQEASAIKLDLPVPPDNETVLPIDLVVCEECMSLGNQ